MFLAILAGAILLLGAAACVIGAVLLYKALEERYRVVKGEVIEARIESYQQHAKDGLIDKYYQGTYRIRYRTGEKLREAVARTQPGVRNEATAKKRLAAHPPGTVHPVRYAPSRPDALVLESPRRAVAMALLIAAGGISLIGAGAATYFASQATEW